MSYVYIVDIEGVATRYCWPQVPSYSDATYLLGLENAPSGASSQWKVADGEMTVGQWRVTFDPDVGAINWYQTERIALAYLASDSLVTGNFTLDRDHDEAGLSDATDYYINRETVTTGTLGAASTTMTLATRGQHGSTAAIHTEGVPIYAHPPALLGRKVTLSRADLTGGSTGSEVVYQRGFVSSDVRGDLWFSTVTVSERGEGATINRDPIKLTVWFPAPDARGDTLGVASGGPQVLGEYGAGAAAPTFSTAGAYLYAPEAGIVFGVPYASGAWKAGEIFPAWPLVVDVPERVDFDVYEVAWSGADATLGFPVFGYDDSGYQATANPIDIVLNILTSLDGTNYNGGEYNWDRGTKLYPHCALGVDISLVDTASFKRARPILESVRARNVWLGGAEKLDVTDLFRGLLASWGFAAGTTRGGVWRLVQLADVYPASSSTAVSASSRQRLGLTVSARQVDRMTIQCDALPDGGGSEYPVIVTDEAGAKFYPEATGEDVEFKASPYQSSDLIGINSSYRSDEAPAVVASLAQSRIRRLGGRLTTVTLSVAPSVATAVEVGDDLLLSGPWLRNPTDGARLAAGATLESRVVSVGQVDWRAQTAQLQAVLMAQSSLRLARHAPSAKVDSAGASDGYTANGDDWDVSVSATTFAADGDAATDYFTAGDVVILLSESGAPQCDVDGTYTVTVVSTSSGTITIDNKWQESGGGTVEVVADDIVTFGGITDVRANGNSDQVANYGWYAQGGLGEETVDTSAVYHYGDGGA